MPTPRWELPFDKFGKLNSWMSPRATALASRFQAITQSSDFELNALTTLLQVTAISKDMFLKWATGGEDYATANDYDEFIPAGTTVYLQVPLIDNSNEYYTHIQIVGREASGSVSVVEK